MELDLRVAQVFGCLKAIKGYINTIFVHGIEQIYCTSIY